MFDYIILDGEDGSTPGDDSQTGDDGAAAPSEGGEAGADPDGMDGGSAA